MDVNPTTGGQPLAPRRRRRWGRRLLRGTGLLALLAVGAGGGVLFFHLAVMPWFVRHGDETAVPDMRGLPAQEIESLLDHAGLHLGNVERAFHAQVPAGRIVRHSPPPGFHVKLGRAVDVVVSLGPEELRVPLVEGENLVHARFLLVQSGLQQGRTRSIYSAEVPEGRVIASHPRPGAFLAGQTSVDLLVSLGPPPQVMVMPDLRGRDPDEATALLEGAGLHVRKRFWPGARSEWPRVAEQSPAPGYPVKAGGTVELTMGRW